MTRENFENFKSQIASVCRAYQIRELRLFGSRARGDFSENSDFDFLYEFEPEAKISFFELGKIQTELETILQSEVDLVPKHGLKDWVREQILSEAEIIYAA